MTMNPTRGMKHLAIAGLIAVGLTALAGCGSQEGPAGDERNDAAVSDNQDHVTVLIEIHAKEGQEQDARDGLLHAIETSHKPGMISSHQYEDLNDPGAFYAVQEWENMEAFQAHMADAAKSGMSEAVQVLREDPRTAMLRAID